MASSFRPAARAALLNTSLFLNSAPLDRGPNLLKSTPFSFAELDLITFWLFLLMAAGGNFFVGEGGNGCIFADVLFGLFSLLSFAETRGEGGLGMFSLLSFAEIRGEGGLGMFSLLSFAETRAGAGGGLRFASVGVVLFTVLLGPLFTGTVVGLTTMLFATAGRGTDGTVLGELLPDPFGRDFVGAFDSDICVIRRLASEKFITGKSVLLLLNCINC
jgi:hypothetical protein